MKRLGHHFNEHYVLCYCYYGLMGYGLMSYGLMAYGLIDYGLIMNLLLLSGFHIFVSLLANALFMRIIFSCFLLSMGCKLEIFELWRRRSC